jgi:glycosyltransferase involved in cell wall biosynthesis
LFVKGSGPGGVERVALRLVAGLRAAGVPVTLLSATFDDALPAACLIAPRWPLIGARMPMLRLGVSLWRAVRRDPPALILCPGNAYTVVAVALKLLLGRRCPPVVAKVSNDLTRRDMSAPLRPLYALWLHMQGRLIDAFAALSPAMRDEVAARMGVARGRVHVVPNPALAEADLVSPVPVRERGPGRRFVAIGRLEPQKDYPAMLRAFAAGAGADDRLTIYGEGSMRPALERLVARLDLADRVHLAGHCPDAARRLAAQDILLLSSRYEGQPAAVVEALAAGLTIVATRCCVGIDGLLDDGALGALVTAGDEAGFARAVAAARPGAQDRVRALAKARGCTIEAAVPAYAALFDAVLAGRADPAPALSPVAPPITRSA